MNPKEIIASDRDLCHQLVGWVKAQGGGVPELLELHCWLIHGLRRPVVLQLPSFTVTVRDNTPAQCA